MTSFIVDGCFVKGEAEAIKRKLAGRTYMNFIIEVSNCMGNHYITVSTEREETTVEELKNLFFWYVLTLLRKIN